MGLVRSRFAVAMLLAALAIIATPRFALAAEPTAAEVAVARRLFGEAAALEKEKKWAEAEAKLREAVAIKETPGLRYHLGHALEQQGKLVEALVEYDRAAEMLERGVKAPDVAELVGPARDGVRKRVPSLTVKLPAGVSGPKVEVDGTDLKAALIGKPMPVNPGDHVVTASAPGRQAFRREITVGEGGAQEVLLELPARAPAGAGAAASGPGASPNAGAKSGAADGGDATRGDSATGGSVGSTRTVVLIAEAAFTVVALGAGVVFTLQKSTAEDDISDRQTKLDELAPGDSSACKSPQGTALKSTCSELADALDRRDKAATFATVGFVAAGVGAAATVATFLLWKPGKRGDSAARWGVAPVASGQAGGLLVRGAF